MTERRPNPNRKDENIRRANRVIQTRSFVLMLVMGIGMFVLLFFQLFDLQIVRHEELQSKAVNQQTRRTVVTASRGTIYDRSGNIMAISASAETVILSPLEIDRAVNDKDDPVTWTKDSLAAGLAEILDGDASAIRRRMDNTESQYELIKLRADEEVADAVRAYINENKIVGVHLVADAKRYYPYGSLASHVIGFVGDDNTGLYGLEARYEQALEGQSGLVVSAKDNAGNDMMYAYEQYFAAQNGSDLTLTLDATIQYYLEKGLENMADKFAAANGAAGIIMDVNTGGILAMASYPNYDLNDFSAVQDQTLQERIARGENTLAEMQLLQWRKALNDTYEPGSTFKILTLAAALEEGVINKNTTVNCSGFVTISGQTIHCSNKAGHGLQTLIQTVGNSCNPAFISYGLKLGNTAFYEYMRSFGLMEGTGIDLSGEADSIFADPASFTQLDLACYAFGQNFNVTPIALITAQAACVNGGYLRTPYLVERITDSNGSVTYQHDSTPIRQVVSEETSATVRECLEYVVASGTGKNGQVAGYRVGGKTGTADKGQTGDVVVSFLCFAPADDPHVIMCPAAIWWPPPPAPSCPRSCPIWAWSPATPPRSCWAWTPPCPMSSACPWRRPRPSWANGASAARSTATATPSPTRPPPAAPSSPASPPSSCTPARISPPPSVRCPTSSARRPPRPTPPPPARGCSSASPVLPAASPPPSACCPSPLRRAPRWRPVRSSLSSWATPPSRIKLRTNFPADRTDFPFLRNSCLL